MDTIWPEFQPTLGTHDVLPSHPEQLQDLPRLMPHFFVPVLEDKPQNPIMESLRLEKANTSLPRRSFLPPKLPQELAVLSLDTVETTSQKLEDTQRSVQQLWIEAASRKLGVRSGLLSWDRLRPSHSDKATPTPFLSEQEELVYTSARYHVQPRLYSGMDSIRFVNQRELLLSLKSTILGISSQLHVWDPTNEEFVQIGTLGNGKQGILLLDGKDDVISASLISRFLTIGTLIRRLELLLASLRRRSAKEGPTIHALAHSLSTTLNYLREILAGCPPTMDEITSTTDVLPLSAIWSHYAVHEELLVALTELYGRAQRLRPEEYAILESSPVPLLSQIFDHLARHFERQSPPIICATIAFILKNTSHGYIQEVAHSIGFGGQPSHKAAKKGGKDHHELYEEEEEEEEDLLDLLDEIKTSFPSFFPERLLHALPAAQKSLVLLRIALPDHPLLTSPTAKSSIRWLWTEEDILAAWDGRALPEELKIVSPIEPSPSVPAVTELSIFGLFDLEPGTKSSVSTFGVQDYSSTALRKFVDRFPQSLPSITPTLAELASLTFKDLMQHASTLSATLLSLFIDSPGKLNFRSHLILLRSYLLLAAPSFKSRLLSALFSDAGEYEVDITPHSMSLRSLRRRPGKKPKDQEKEGKQPWAVGLSPNLLERETWPPVGADLSFFLRTVIVDSLDRGKETEEGTFEREDVVEEAGWRLGFAIRDLPTGAGKDKWLDPLSIEALDFLYMDYKPPHPLEILISPEILAKYQRMFTFILRLLRVECALKSLFRMSTHRAIAKVLFPTLAQSRKLLLHFRFVAQAFVSSLSGYVFDTAIGGNFDPFLARLSADLASDSDPNNREDGFSDIFELAQCHSGLLDDILSACLLRSGQRGVGDLLRHSLELVLEFTIVVGELHRGRIEEYQAAPLVEELFSKLCTKMTTLTRVLKGLVDKSPSSSKLSLDAYSGARRRPTGGLDALYHLLIRIDLTDWWSKSSPKTG